MSIIRWEVSSLPANMMIGNLYEFSFKNLRCSVHLHSDLDGVSVSCVKEDLFEYFVIRKREIMTDDKTIENRQVIIHHFGEWIFMNNFQKVAIWLPEHIRQLFGGCFGIN